MQVALLACYEQGHQPFSLASPLAILRQAGFAAEAFDTSVQHVPDKPLIESSMVAISTPMHTALRLAVPVAARIRRLNPDAHICFYGLYAWLNGDFLLARDAPDGRAVADSIIGGEFEAPLLALAKRLEVGQPADGIAGLQTASGQPGRVNLRRPTFERPDRTGLPAVDQYARLARNGELLPAGYTEASRGCLHRCRHCPVVPVYDGRFFVVPAETVLSDIRQQVASGAQHVTFGDPDFLNGPGHGLRIARAMRREFPDLSFDFTTKVEHILEHAETVRELASLGAAFVVSAFESTSERVLARLRKDHSLADMEQALAILGTIGLPIQATWVPFTPWTTLDDYLHMLAWIREQDLVQHVAPVQLSIRLLVPPGSALLDHPDRDQWVGSLDAASFSYRWQHEDPRMELLQRQVAECVEQNAHLPSLAQFELVETLAYALAGRSLPGQRRRIAEPAPAPPKLTEDWFC
jgi:radical SAM superfamily enzyme YgiQ (UPF0313 family)